MAKEEIIDGNKMIAEFMNCPIDTDKIGHAVVWVAYPMQRLSTWIRVSETKYDSSWDWLMPVVEKINSITIDNYGEMNVMIQADQCRIGETWDDSLQMVTRANHPNLIKMVWVAVTSFIQWYNKNSNTNSHITQK